MIERQAPFHKEENMATRLPIIDRIKVLFQGEITNKQFTFYTHQTYEVEILPSSTARASKQHPFAGKNMSRRTAALSMLQFSGGADPLRVVNHEGTRKVQQTQSNLG
jgi:hypothetical protein